MVQLRLEPDAETYDRLVAMAAAERRPVPWHAVVVLRRALGLQFPYPTAAEREASAEPPATVTPSAGEARP